MIESVMREGFLTFVKWLPVVKVQIRGEWNGTFMSGLLSMVMCFS